MLKDKKINLKHFPKPYQLKSYNIARRVHVLENLQKFFGGRLELGLLSFGKITPCRRDLKLKELVVELSDTNEYNQTMIVCKPSDNVASRYVLLNNLSLKDVHRFVHDKGYHNHEGAVIIQLTPDKFQVWLNLGNRTNIKRRKIIVNYFTNAHIITEWGFAPCFLNVHDEWQVEYVNHFYIRISNGKSFITTVNNGIRYRFSENLIKYITEKMYEVSA